LADFTVAAAAQAMDGRIAAGEAGARISGAAIDSRRLRGGELFFAFAGERTDGHRFVGDALMRGAAAAVVERARGPHGAPGRGALIEVESSLAALHGLARSLRTRLPEKLVAVTGSAGKTTTKELLAAMLARRFRVARTPGNLNNAYGFPLSLLNLPEDAEWMVAEMGMSSAGELRQLSLLGRPDVALFTVVRPVHLEFFRDLREIAEAKAELLAGLAPDGVIVANADDPEVLRLARRAEGGRRLVLYSSQEHPEAAVLAREIAALRAGQIGTRFILEAGGDRQEVVLPLLGRYNAENYLAAAAAAWAIGVPLADIAAAAQEAQPAAMRGVVHRTPAGFTLIDDSYNSNPDSLARALESAAELPAGRRLAVLGDMLELGPEAPRFHHEAGERAARLGFAIVAGVGELAREVEAGAREAGAAETAWHPDAEAAAGWAAAEVEPGDLVLVKGSRRVGLETVVHRLLGQGPTRSNERGQGPTRSNERGKGPTRSN
jgi:UDP-N-acetylmuramoyl-tripeptide--D-alanyl-D-alanine ligase